MNKQPQPSDDEYANALNSLLGTLDQLETAPIVPQSMPSPPVSVATTRPPLARPKASQYNNKPRGSLSATHRKAQSQPVASTVAQDESKPTAPPFDQLNIPGNTPNSTLQTPELSPGSADDLFVSSPEYDRIENDQITPQQFRELLATPIDERNTQSGTSAQSLDPVALNQLLRSGYEEHEIQSLIADGLSPIVLQKLTNKDLALSPQDSMTCITQCIQMGANEANKAQNRDLLVVLGNTGAGKSTSINYWLGCKMVRTGGGLRTHIEVAYDSPVKELMTIGHATRSKTFIPKVHHTKLPFSVCDTPGFFDNRGAEINIANAINIRNTLHHARSARIVVLINYYSLLADRGRGVKALNTMLSELFGDSAFIEQHRHSFVIGITHTPSEHNDRHQIIAHFNAKKCLPPHVTSRMFVVDPLNQSLQTGCNQAQWLKQLSELTPITDTNSLFTSLLSDSDQLLLIKMSKQLSITIREQVANENLLASRDMLRALLHMSTIGVSEINQHYDAMLALLDHYLASQKASIEQSCRENPFDGMQQRVLAFCTTLQHFQNDLITCEQQGLDLLKTWHNAQVDVLTQRLEKTLNVLLTQFHQDAMEQDDLALDVTVRLASCINKNLSTAEINTSLQVLLGCVPLRSSIQKLLSTLAELYVIYPLCDAQSSWQNALKQMNTTLQDLYASASTTIHQQRTLRDQQQQTILLKTVEHMTSIGTWHQHVPTIIELLTSCTTIDQLEDTLQRLANLPLPQYQQNAPTLLAGLQQLVLPPIQASTRQSMLRTLRKHLDGLVAMQQQHDNQLAKEQAQAQIEQFIDSFKHLDSLDNKLLNTLSTLYKQYQTLTPNQQKTITATHVINSTLNELFKSALQRSMDELTIEEHADQLGELDASKAFHTVADVEHGIWTLPTNPLGSLKSLTELTQTCSLFERTGTLDASKLCANFTHQYHVKIEQAAAYLIKKAKAQSQQAKLDRARSIIETINQTLLPEKKYAAMRPLIDELNTIAPGQMTALNLATTLSKLKTAFQDNLHNKRYPQAIAAHSELDQIITALGPLVVKECQIDLDLKALSAGLHGIIEQSLEQVQCELLDVFSDNRLKNEDNEPRKLESIDPFFGLLKQFQSSMKVDQWEQLYATQSRKILQAVGQWLYGYRTCGIFARFLMQAIMFREQTAAHHRDCANTINTSFNAMLKKINATLLTGIGQELMQYASKTSPMKDYAQMLLKAFPVFSQAKNAISHEQQKTQSFEFILQNTRIVKSISRLEKAHMVYQQTYDRLVKEPIKSGANKDKLCTSLIEESRRLAGKLSIEQPLSQSFEISAQLVACVYGVWGLIDIDLKSSTQMAERFMRRPFPGQILGSFLLLGLDDDAPVNQFLSAPPGDGKSLIIATCAIIYGLIGFEVDITSVYQYVSVRSSKAYGPFIARFSLNRVSYTVMNETISQLFERKYDLSQRLAAFMTKNIVIGKHHKSKRMLIHDECDVMDLRPTDVYPLYSFLPFSQYGELIETLVTLHGWDNRTRHVIPSTEAKRLNKALKAIEKNLLSMYPRLSKDDFNAIKHDIVKVIGSGSKFSYSVEDREMVMRLSPGHNPIANLNQDTHYVGPRCADAVTAYRFYTKGEVDKVQFTQRVAAGIPFLLGEITAQMFPDEYERVALLSASPLTNIESRLRMVGGFNILGLHQLPSFFKTQKKGINQEAQNLYVNEEELEHLAKHRSRIKLANIVASAMKNNRAVIYITRVVTDKMIRTLTENLSTELKDCGEILTLSYKQTPASLEIFERKATKSRTFSIICERHIRTLDLTCYDHTVNKNGGVVIISASYNSHKSDLTHRIGLAQRHGQPGDFWILHCSGQPFHNKFNQLLRPDYDVVITNNYKDKNGDMYDLLDNLANHPRKCEPEYSLEVKRRHQNAQGEALSQNAMGSEQEMQELYQIYKFYNALHGNTIKHLTYLIIATSDQRSRPPSSYSAAKKSLQLYIRGWMRVLFDEKGYLEPDKSDHNHISLILETSNSTSKVVKGPLHVTY